MNLQGSTGSRVNSYCGLHRAGRDLRDHGRSKSLKGFTTVASKIEDDQH
jgi:hypothetical protein